MKLLITVLVFAILGMSGCNSPGCTVETTVANLITPALVSALNCSNSAAVLSDIETLIGKTGICSQPTSNKPKLPSGMCDAIAGVIVKGLNGTIPSAWGCSGGMAQNGLQSLISMACQKI